MLVCIAETGSQFEHDEQDIVYHERPFAAPAIRGDTECDGAHRSKHEHKGDAPGDVRDGLVELLGQFGGGQGDREEIKRIPGPAEEGDLHMVSGDVTVQAVATYQEEEPLLAIQQGQGFERVRSWVHRRHQRRDARQKVFSPPEGVSFVPIDGTDGLRHGIVSLGRVRHLPATESCEER